MSDYGVVETAIILEMLNHFSDYLPIPELIKAGEVDVVLDAMLSKSLNYGILLEFGGGRRRTDEPYKGQMWQWTTVGSILIRYVGDTTSIESDLRALIKLLANIFQNDHTLGGVCAKAALERIELPEQIKINDCPMYLLPFEISIMERV